MSEALIGFCILLGVLGLGLLALIAWRMDDAVLELQALRRDLARDRRRAADALDDLPRYGDYEGPQYRYTIRGCR